MGLFNIEEFLMAQQCCWIFRCFISCRDNWRNDIFELSLGNPLSFSPLITDERRHPVLFKIACSYERFRAKFEKTNENYLTSCIFYNPIIFREQRDKRVLTPEFLSVENNNELAYRIANTELQTFCGPEGFLNRAELGALNIQLTEIGYGRLSNALHCFFDRMSHHRDNPEKSVSIKDEFCSIKKPGRKCRKVLGSGKSCKLEKLTTVVTFFKLTELTFTGNENFSVNVSWWNFNCMSNRIRMFAFKFFNNLLGINNRTSHFAVNPTRGCTFCTLDGHIPAPDETFKHLFYSCPTTRSWQMRFIDSKFNGIQLTEEENRKFWFLGLLPNEVKPNLAVLCAVMIFQFCCWEEKLRKRRPSFLTLNNMFEDLFYNTFDISPLHRDACTGLAFSIFRPYRGLLVP
jgi:hypothetical protein